MLFDFKFIPVQRIFVQTPLADPSISACPCMTVCFYDTTETALDSSYNLW